MAESVATGVFVDSDFLNLFFQVLLFYFERKLHFSQKKEDCLKKTALSDYFLKNIIIVVFTLVN